MNAPAAGNFQLFIEGLIKQIRSLGYLYDTSARILKAFSRFCESHYPSETVLHQEMAMHWAEKRPGEHVNTLMRRITPVRQLAKYINRLGHEAYVIPPGIPGKQPRYVPHIFSDQELQAFFAEIDRCPANPHSPARHLVIPVLFRVLYCCGLRSSEVRRLSLEDVDLETGKLRIRESKGHKDRNVMMSKDLLELCRVYHSKVSCIFPDRLAFFPNPCGTYYNDSMIDFWFQLFWKRTGVSNICHGNPPRVHDFRHSFAVRRLNLWVQEEKDLNACLPYLCMYLGHAHLTETDYYLHFVPDFFPIFKQKTLEKCANLIPEVAYEER